jgi:hypothetical protein
MKQRFPARSDLPFSEVPHTWEPAAERASCGRSQLSLGFALLAQLEASLTASQQALLSRDLPALERATCEQRLLEPQIGQLRRAFRPVSKSSPLEIEVRVTSQRILHLARVQLALLARARRSLSALEQLLAGPGAAYAPPMQTTATHRPALSPTLSPILRKRR